MTAGVVIRKPGPTAPDGRPIVVTQAGMSPDQGTPVVVAADTPLSLSKSTNPHDTDYIIPSGETFTLQWITAGCQGDPSEKGSAVEVYYVDTEERLVARVYVNGTTIAVEFPSVTVARDDTDMVGNGSNKIRVRRRRLNNQSQEVDAVLYGYLVETS